MTVNRRPYKLILFDLDGTIADSLRPGLAVMNRLRHIFRYAELSESDPRLRLVSGYDFARQILKLNMLQIVIWSKLLKFMVTSRAAEITVYRGWKTVVRKLRRRYRLGLATSAPRAYAETILTNAGICAIEPLATDIPYLGKTAALRRLLADQELAARDVLYIGDELRDLKACQQLGLPFVAAGWGKDHPSLFMPHRPAVRGILQKPGDLLRFLGEGSFR